MLTKKIITTCAALALALPFSMASTPVFAAEPVSAAAVRLPEIVVSATRTARELFDVAASAAVVTSQDMRREPQTTIAQQLQDIPGLQVSDGGMGGGAKRISIRGESASRVLILIDGMKISEQKSMDGSMILISPENIERIEVIKGPASVLYGSEAIGGVVNIITKKGGSKPLQATIASKYDSSNDSFTPSGSFYGAYEGFSYRVSGDYTDAGNKHGGSGSITNTNYMQKNYSAYLDYSWANAKVGAGYDKFWANINVPSAESEGAFVQPDLPRWDRERFYAFAEVEKISQYLQKIKLTGFTQETRKDFGNQIDVHQVVGSMMGKDMTVDVNSNLLTKNDQRSYGATLQTDWTLGESHYIVAGVDYLRDNLTSRETRDSYTTTVMPPFFIPTTRPSVDNGNYKNEAHQENWSIFIQDEWTFDPDWTATLGLRQSFVQSALDTTNDAKLETGSDSDSNLVGSAGLVYSGLEDWRFRAQYSQGYRYPLLQQLYMGTVHGSADITYPNPNLKPEKSHSFELGSRYEANDIAADLAVYYTTATDYIYRASHTVNGTTSYQFDNSNSADTYGSELTLSYTYQPWHLTPYVSGNYMYRQIDRGSENGGKTSQTGDPRWSGRVGVRYEDSLTPEVSLHADAFARLATSSKQADTNGTVIEKGGWATANLSVGTRLGKDQDYFIDVNLNNITNKRYTPAASSLEDPGMNVVVSVGMDF